jgi:hypothetical protein
VSLNPPRQPSGAKVHRSGPDAEALLLEAVRHRRGHESLVRLQRCVHRRGLDWLEKFQALTLPALEGNDAAAWFAALLGDGSLGMPADRQGVVEEQAWIEQRATAAVDGAIASMLAEFPELIPQVQPRGFALPLTLAPPSSQVPEVLPERLPPPVFSFTSARDLAPIQEAGLALEILPGELADESAKEGHSHPEPSGSAASMDDHAPFEGLLADSAQPRQRSAAEIGAALRSSLLRRFSRTQWRSLARIRTDRVGSPQVPDPAVAPSLQPLAPEELPGAVASPSPAGATTVLAQDRGIGAGTLPQPPDPLAVVVRLAERRSEPNLQQDAAPAPRALADLRAWLPDPSLARAS